MPEYYPGYIPAPRRTDEQILAELDRRCGYVQGEVKIIDPSEASPPPEETKPPRMTVKYIPSKTERRKK